MDGNQSPVTALSRRQMLRLGATGAAIPLLPNDRAEAAASSPPQNDLPAATALSVNGHPVSVRHDVRTTLLDALREGLGLTGTKKGCDHGQCGACTVLVVGRPTLSCLSLLAAMEGKSVVTIEGLASTGGQLHPMQQAFIDQDAFQCGYCTPGQIMSAVGCVTDGHADSDARIREYMSGNLCRCAAYPNIVAAIRQARAEMKGA